MSIEPIKTEVRGLLARTNYDIDQAERTLVRGAGEDRVHAASRLVLLRRHKRAFEARMSDLDHSPDGAIPTVVQCLKENWMLVSHSLETWFEGD
jgi:hypothetical protein